MQTYREINFEEHIEQHLNQSCYRSLQPTDYNKSLCLIPDEMLQFIQDTQPKCVSETRTPVRGRHTAETCSPYQQPDCESRRAGRVTERC